MTSLPRLERKVIDELGDKAPHKEALSDRVFWVFAQLKKRGIDYLHKADLFSILGKHQGIDRKDWPRIDVALRKASHESAPGVWTQKTSLSGKDSRDDLTWVVLELTASGEAMAIEGGLEGYLRALFKEPALEVFVPYQTIRYEGRVSLYNVIEGYCFVAHTIDERAYRAGASQSPYIRSVLSYEEGSMPTLQTVPNSAVEDLRLQLAKMASVEICEGMSVTVTRGPCSGLHGKVVSIDSEEACVLIKMRTLVTIRTIPRFALLPEEVRDEL